MPKLTFEKAVGSISKEHKIDIESVSNMNVLYPNQNQLTKQKPHQRGIKVDRNLSILTQTTASYYPTNRTISPFPSSLIPKSIHNLIPRKFSLVPETENCCDHLATNHHASLDERAFPWCSILLALNAHKDTPLCGSYPA